MELDEVLSGYSTRKASEDEAKKRKSEADAIARGKAIPLLQGVVLTAFEEVAVSVRAKGHKTEVKSSIEGLCYPSVTLGFTPVNPRSDRYDFAMPSELTVAHAGSEQIRVSKKISGRDTSGSHRSTDDSTTVTNAAVTQEWARTLAVGFIKSALDSN